MNGRIKELIQQLGEAIHESVSESEQISGVVREIREEGFDVLLMLEATIGLNEVTDDVEDSEEASSGGTFTRMTCPSSNRSASPCRTIPAKRRSKTSPSLPADNNR